MHILPLHIYMHRRILLLEHDDGAGHETTTETALRGKVNRAMTPRGRAQKRKRSSSTTHHTKEHTVKHGHVVGTKREKQGSQDWYREIEEENIRKIEAEWQAKQGK
jgi:hypothetical protein